MSGTPIYIAHGLWYRSTAIFKWGIKSSGGRRRMKRRSRMGWEKRHWNMEEYSRHPDFNLKLIFRSNVDLQDK
ncbi:hypothetical protein ACS0TY_022555 [Phlomoides rotata]